MSPWGEEDLGDHVILFDFNAKADAFVGSYLGGGIGASLVGFNQDFYLDVEVLDVPDGVVLKDYLSVTSEKIVEIEFSTLTRVTVDKFKYLLEDGTISFSISNVSASFNQSLVEYTY